MELLEPLSYPFMQRAWAAGALAATASALTGAWVVFRGHAFLAEALGHGMLPGVALAAVIGFDPVLGALLGVIVMVAGIATVGRTTALGDDTATGLLLVGMLALGVIVISREDTFAVDLTAVLFGDVLGISSQELWLQAATLAVVVVTVTVLFRALVALSYDEDSARALGLRPAATHGCLLVLVALAAVSGFRTVGALLVLALLVAPAAAAALVASTVASMLALSIALGLVAVTAGLLASFHLDTAGGATVAAFAVSEFFALLAFSKGRKKWRSRPAAKS